MLDVKESRDIYLSEFQQLKESGGAQPWLLPTRKAAIDRFLELGFPTTRDEEWKYTNVTPIAKTAFEQAGVIETQITFDDISDYQLDKSFCQFVFINGRYSSKLSSPAVLPEGVKICSLADAMQSEQTLVKAHLAKYADYENHAFTALNTAFMQDGAFVFVPRGVIVRTPIYLLFVSTANGRAIVSHPRNLIICEANSQVSVIESYAGLDNGKYFTNAVTEFVVGENAVIDHYKVEQESDEAFHVTTRQIYQERNSNVSSHTVTYSGGLIRNDVNTVLDGEGCNCMLNGLYVLRGSQHADHHLRVEHAKPHCNSWEYYKGILSDQSRGVFTGRIIVREDAQKTDAKQSNMNLLLSPDALVDTKPQLEILADDVKCTHGATIGQIDEDAIFYLRSRGISKEAARSLLTYAFAGESLGQVRIEPLRERLLDLLSTRLPHGQSLRFGRPFEYDDDFSKIVRSADKRRET